MPTAPEPAPAARDSSDQTVPEPAPPPAGPVDAQAVKEAWGRIVDGVMQAQRSLGSFLQEGRLQRVEGSVLWLAFAEQDRFNMSQVEKNRAVVEAMCEQVIGAPLRVRCTVDSGDTPAAEAGPAAIEGQPAGARQEAVPARKAGADVNPAVKSVLDAFDGEVV